MRRTDPIGAVLSLDGVERSPLSTLTLVCSFSLSRSLERRDDPKVYRTFTTQSSHHQPHSLSPPTLGKRHRKICSKANHTSSFAHLHNIVTQTHTHTHVTECVCSARGFLTLYLAWSITAKPRVIINTDFFFFFPR